MIRKVSLGSQDSHVFGNPAPLGLLGLAIASFAILPITFGLERSREGLLTAALYALLFGAGCQLLTGLMDFANKNAFGGAIFTTFAFMWMKNAAELYLAANGHVLSHTINFTIDAILLVVFIILAFGFGFFSAALFIFLVDINLIYVCKIVNFVTKSAVMTVPLGVFTLLMALIALWIAFAALINPVSGAQIFKSGVPVFKPPPRRQLFDFSIRNAIFTVLYDFWKEQAYALMPLAELQTRVGEIVEDRNIIPYLYYLQDYGSLVMTFSDPDSKTIEGVRLNAAGIDLYEQLILKKYEF